jgi:hypothetical protein
VNATPTPHKRLPWNKGKLTGAKPPLRPKHVWSIRTKLQIEGRTRDLAMFNLAIDSKLRGCDVVAIRVEDVAAGGYTADRATVPCLGFLTRFEPDIVRRRPIETAISPTGERHMRNSILIALILLTGMSSAWAKNDRYTLKPHGHSRTATVRHADMRACAGTIDEKDRSAFEHGAEAGDIVRLLPLFGELKRKAACMRAHGLVSTSKRSSSAKEIDDAVRHDDEQRLLNEQWRREESN